MYSICVTAIRAAIGQSMHTSILQHYSVLIKPTERRAVLGVLNGDDFVAAVDPAERGHVALDQRPRRDGRRCRRRARIDAAAAAAAAVGEERARRRLRNPAAAAARGAFWRILLDFLSIF